MRIDVEELFERALKGDIRSISRILTIAEFPGEIDPEIYRGIVKRVIKNGGRAHVIGVTGSPGVGKSTLISKLISMYRSRGERIGVITIDPTSPFSRGSFMGNRIRMQHHSQDPNVFIRSTATRGVSGGLSISTVMLVEVFDGLGFDRIFIESVGVGQIDVDIHNIAHTLINVLIPGAGDDIQLLKAGLMEIGDFYVLNKADKPESEQMFKTLREILEILQNQGLSDWKPKAYKVSAVLGTGIEDLVKGLDEHREYLMKTGSFGNIVSRRRKYSAKIILRHLLEKTLENYIDREKEYLDRIALGEIDPFTGSVEIFRRFVREIHRIR
ncbi:MAG: methylmalonyl Co-A mutase-associated GTPase MeaB [Sulfolobales archaeon]